MSEITFGPGVQVVMHFSLKMADGSVVDSNFDKSPVSFTVGDGNMSPGFEEAMYGMLEGEENSFLISPEKGFGQHNPSNIQTIPRDQFPADVELEKGLVMSFSDAKNTDLPGVVLDFTAAQVTIDFNHPLAGREITFDVKIISLAPSVTH